MLQGQDLLHMLMDMWPSLKLVFFVCCDIVYLFIYFWPSNGYYLLFREAQRSEVQRCVFMVALILTGNSIGKVVARRGMLNYIEQTNAASKVNSEVSESVCNHFSLFVCLFFVCV